MDAADCPAWFESWAELVMEEAEELAVARGEQDQDEEEVWSEDKAVE
jgi:hypothetical protein